MTDFDTALLIKLADTYRRSGDKDYFGQPAGDGDAGPADEIYLSDLPCWVSVGSGGEQGGSETMDVVGVTYSVTFRLGHDITEKDTIILKNADGSLIAPKANISQVRIANDGDGPHHMVVTCKVER
jgi:hypothetical protein